MPTSVSPDTDVSPRLAEFSSPGLLIPRLQGGDAASIMHELAAALHREGCIPEVLPFYQAAMNREFLGGTSLASGWALPHATVKGLEKPCFALGLLARPLSWFSSRRAVRGVCLTAVPETDMRGYLLFMAAMNRLGHADQERLLDAEDSVGMFEVLRRV